MRDEEVDSGFDSIRKSAVLRVELVKDGELPAIDV